MITIWTPTSCSISLNSTSTRILTIHTKNSILIQLKKERKTNHGFGEHGFNTTIVGHGVTIHAQLPPQGARVATVVVVVVVLITNR